MLRRPLRPAPAPAPIPALAAALVLAAGLAAAAPAAGDTLLTLKNHRDGFRHEGMSQPPHDATVELWIGDGRIRRDDGTMAVVVSGDRLLLVNHETRSYSVLGLPVDLETLLPESMRQTAEMWKLAVEITPREETRRIGDWNAKRYDVELTNALGLAMSSTLWITGELEVDLAPFRRLSSVLASLQPGGAETMRPLAELPGFPVLLETTADMAGTVVRSEERLQSVERREPPAGLYEPPAGYAERAFRPGDAPGM
jgi:hypothetical protein